MRTDFPRQGYRAPAVGKAFKLLDLVAASDQGMGISELARRLGYSKGTTHGLTQALMTAGAIFQSPVNKKFFLGTAILELSLKNRNFNRISRKAQPLLDRLRDSIDQTVFLGILTPPRAMIIATAEPSRSLKISSPPGTTIPIMAGAVGKVFLSALDHATAADMIKKLGLGRFTDHSIVNEDQYLEGLDLVRAKGYALDKEEYLSGVNAVAMALGDQHGLMLALWAVGFTNTLSAAALPGIVQSMQETAASLNRAIPV